MGKIIELDQQLANQIAAGEVVERPASVVKELVENSIDAGATKIVVKIEEAGLKLMEVIDNGFGIEQADVSLALKRHATSKIKERADLFRIRTLGFRGEALPSIASVSDLVLETSVETEAAGTRLVAHGGKIEKIEPMSKRTGTKISVSNLFYNTPARLKYIKSLQAELAHITDILNRLSLAHPEVSFSLINDGHELLRTSGSGDLRQTIASVYGVATAKKMQRVSAEDLDFEVEGFVSFPELTRSNQNYITLLINGRYIKNFLLRRAVLDGYGSRIMVGRFPLAVISVKIDPQLADVNVHPTKQEVRLSKEKELMGLIVKAINNSLSETVLIPDALENLQKRVPLQPEKSVQTELPLRQTNLYYDKERQDFYLKENNKAINSTSDVSRLAGMNTEQILPDVLQSPKNHIYTSSNHFIEVAEETPSFLIFPELEYLAQLHATYLLCQSPDGLYLVDQHAAQERINVEIWEDKIGEVSIDQQILLTPYLFDLPKNDFISLSEKKDLLYEAGVFLEEYGENQFILREHPIWLNENEIEQTVYEMIDIVLSSKDFSLKKYRHDLAAMVACKSSIKAGQVLDTVSARQLLTDLSRCKNPYSCAHGRPTIVQFSGDDIQRMFRRIQETHRSKAASWKDLN